MNTLNPNASDVPQLETNDAKLVATMKTGFAVFLGLVIAISWMGFIDGQSEQYLDGAVNQALVAYAVARGVNALVSVLQTIHFFGLGVGEVLDPLNDLVERFSSVMELAIASLYIQKVLLAITSSAFVKMALTVSGGLLILSLYVRTGLNNLFISRVFISLVFVRFCIAIVVALNGLVAAAFVNDKIDSEVLAIEQVEKSAPIPEPTADDMSEAATPPGADSPDADTVTPNEPAPAKQGFFGKLKDIGAKGMAIAKEKFKRWNPKALKEKLEKVVPQMLNTMALFLLKSLILPLVFLYGLKYAATQFWGLKPIPLYTGKSRLKFGTPKKDA